MFAKEGHEMPNKSHLILAGLAALAILVACGGGGGGPSPVPVAGGGTPTPVSSPGGPPSPVTTPGSATTNASGVVVNDANGSPLAGAPVKLMPWGPCGAVPPAAQITPENDGCPTPLPSPQATTNPQGQFVLNGAPNGHYLLVIGTDAVSTPLPGYSPGPAPTPTTVPCPTGQTPPCYAAPEPTAAPFTVQATVHDNVTLTGGNQTLLAPSLPPVPAGYTPPVWETNGEYRLATLDKATEMPCLVAWQYERVQHGLAMSSVDEWSLENVRAVNAYAQTPNATSAPWPGNPTGIISFGGSQVSGGTDCANSNVIWAFNTPGSNSLTPQVPWFFGQYDYYIPGVSTTSAYGLSEFPVDPRANTNPQEPVWP